ncbi:hypothetical protein CVT26_008837 [Gymnopilus dilepis]|uniref:F-box domain-containing protein n=1 Tax=Gymnopilus dilepis TaxID=231916 RepID=A0A409YGE4_9AGAR|nr:hypothetical protein CVT26_008837 [Gymnopilus dilepis]
MDFYMDHSQAKANPAPRRLCQSDSACCAVCQTVVDFQDQLAKARAVVQDLQDRIGALELRTDLNRSHPSIIDRLPQEIASEIFVYRAAEASHAREIIRLGAVCRNWRRIAWSSQRVWTRLIIRSRRSRVLEKHIPLVKEWLDRSGRLPLSITWIQPSLEIFCEEFDQYPMVQILNSQAHRWESLDLDLPGVTFSLFDASTATDPPTLKTLKLNASEKGILRTTKLSLPTPRVIEISPELGVDIQTFNWKLASHITVALPTAESVLRILEQGAHILAFKVQLNDDLWEFPSNASLQITHSLLKDLDINFNEQDSLEVFMKSVTLPALEHLHLRASDIVLQVPIFISFLTRSSVELKSLTFDGVGLSPEGFIPIAPLIPSLERLTIELPSRRDDNFRRLYFALANCISSTNPDAILPSLQDFHWCGESIFPWKVLPYYLRPLSPQDPTSCRPLKLIRIHCTLNSRRHELPVISEELFAQLSRLADRVKLQLRARYDGDTSDLMDMWKFIL